MTLRTDKALKSKKFRGKKVYILAKDIDLNRKLEIQPKKFRLEKGLFLIQAVVSKTLRLFDKIFFLSTKY